CCQKETFRPIARFQGVDPLTAVPAPVSGTTAKPANHTRERRAPSKLAHGTDVLVVPTVCSDLLRDLRRLQRLKSHTKFAGSRVPHDSSKHVPYRNFDKCAKSRIFRAS